MSRMLTRLGWSLVAALSACAHGNVDVASTTAPGPIATATPELEPRDDRARGEAASNLAPAPASRCALAPLTEASSAELIERMGTHLERYQLEGGVWLAHAPVLLNQDFDFATALAMGPVGAGLAAGKRLEANRLHAAALSEMSLSPEIRGCLDQLRAAGVHAYFVLWGADTKTLRLVIDVATDCESQVKAGLIHGSEHPQATWASEDTLSREAARVLAQAPQSSAFARCNRVEN